VNFDECKAAIDEAKRTISIADQHIAAMARIIAGKLRSGGVSDYVLEQLKVELRDYNIHTSSWRKE